MKVHGNPQETLLGHATEALRQVLDVEAALQERQDHRPSPGDLFVFEATREHELEWLVLLRGEDSRWLVVPADTVPLVGSADVEVPPHSPGGPLSLRCRWGVWVEARDFVSAHRVGVVSQEDLDRAQRKWREIEEGRIQATVTEQDVDGDPEYGEWERVLASAHETLQRAREPAANESSRSSVSSGSPTNGSYSGDGAAMNGRSKGGITPQEAPVPGPSDASDGAYRPIPFWRKVRSKPLAMAASVLLALALGIAGGWIRDRQALLEQERSRAQQAEAQAEKAEQKNREAQRDITSLNEQLKTKQIELDEANSRTRQALQWLVKADELHNRPAANPAHIELSMGSHRGAEETTIVPHEKQYVLLTVISAVVPETGDRWLLRDRARGKLVLETEEVSATMVFPKVSIPTGEYEVQLLRNGRVVESRVFSIKWE